MARECCICGRSRCVLHRAQARNQYNPAGEAVRVCGQCRKEYYRAAEELDRENTKTEERREEPSEW